ncbi:MAG: pitrilysin family protein [Cyclobacteriaceae bacterium]
MLDRTLAPPFVKTTSFQLPPFTKTKLLNGVTLIHLDTIAQELVKIEIVFEAGKWFESKPEAAHFTIQMLDKGTKSKSSQQIAELFDRYGAHIELSSNYDYASVSLYTLSKHLAKLYPIFLELITDPSFSNPELNQLKEHFIQGLKVKSEKTSYLASKLIRKKLFGPTHPYGQSVEEADVKEIQVSDLELHFQERMRPSHVFILGQISQSDLTILQNSLGELNSNVIAEPAFSSSESEELAEHLEKVGSIQTSIRLGKRTIQRDHPNYAGLLILNYYLGGYFGARLMKNLREEKGLTYGISASINSFKNDCIILIGTDVNKENRKLAVDEIFSEIKLLHSALNEEELELARRHFIGSLQSETASPFSILGKVKNLELHNLPPDYYQNLISQIDKVTPEELSAISQKHFEVDSFQLATVG